MKLDGIVASIARWLGLAVILGALGSTGTGLSTGGAARAADGVTALYLDNITDGHVAGYIAGQALVLQGATLNWARGEEYGGRPCNPPVGVTPPAACDGWLEVVYSGGPERPGQDATWSVGLAAPLGETLEVGTYTGAVHPPDRTGSQPGIRVGLLNGGYCMTPTGWFTIHEISWSGSSLATFSATFRQVCAGTQEVWGPLWGEVRYNASTGFTAAVTGAQVLDLGSADTGTQVADQSVTITSAGTGPVQLGTASITGPGAGSFEIATDTCSGRQLQPGQSCLVGVSARPRRNGDIRATLVVPDDTVRGERSIRLLVTGIGEVDATATIAPSRFYPVVDGYRDRLLIAGTRTEAARIHIAVRTVPGGDLVEETARPEATGAFRIEWDGRPGGGDPAPAGDYEVVATLTDAAGNELVVRKTITLSHDWVTWKRKTVTLDARRVSLWGRSNNAVISLAPPGSPRGVRLDSRAGSAVVIYTFPVGAQVYGSMTFKVYGRSANGHRALSAIWNPALGSMKDLGSYDAAKLVGPGRAWWKVTFPGDGRAVKGKVRAAVMVWKGLGGAGASIFDVQLVRLDYQAGELHRVAGASVASVPRRGSSTPRLGRTVGMLAPDDLPSLAPAPALEPPEQPEASPGAVNPPGPLEPTPTPDPQVEAPTTAPQPNSELGAEDLPPGPAPTEPATPGHSTP